MKKLLFVLLICASAQGQNLAAEVKRITFDNMVCYSHLDLVIVFALFLLLGFIIGFCVFASFFRNELKNNKTKK
jgi:uncharacterized membrane protein YciS (DUF1049 family)